jgi:hypothetical protein
LIKNHVREMLEKLKTTSDDISWPDYPPLNARVNVLKYGTHVEMYAQDEFGSIIPKDITKEFLGLKPEHTID